MVVDRFFIWVGQATGAQKRAAIDALVAAWVSPNVGDDEREAIEAALTLVAEDDDLDVRRRLAECLAEEPTAPRHILQTLLDDHPIVAAPIAGRSEALIDAELVDLVAHGGDTVRRAVADRPRVGPTVATALAEACDRPTAVALLANPRADVPALALERLVERFGEFSDLRAALLARPHVPITVRHRVLEKLAEAIETLVVVKAWMGSERAGVATRDARDKATLALAGTAGTAETVVLVDHLRRSGQLTTRLMLRAACVGHLRFVEEALASLSGVPATRVTALVADGRESALRALYRRCEMPDRAWPAFHAAIEVHRDLLAETGGFDGRPGERARFARRLVERVLTRVTAIGRADADDLLVLLRRYAAEAARDHVRHVMAERTADATRAIAAPHPAEPERPAVSDRGDLDALALQAVAQGLGVVDFDVAPEPLAILLAEPAEPAEPPAGRAAPAVHAVEPSAPVVFGLFDHVRLEDLPADWLGDDEIDPEVLWGDDDVPYRRTLGAEGRESVDAPPAAVPPPSWRSEDEPEAFEFGAGEGGEPSRPPSDDADPFVVELEASLTAVLGPLPERLRGAA